MTYRREPLREPQLQTKPVEEYMQERRAQLRRKDRPGGSVRRGETRGEEARGSKTRSANGHMQLSLRRSASAKGDISKYRERESLRHEERFVPFLCGYL